jgi:hypothetical protein
MLKHFKSSSERSKLSDLGSTMCVRMLKNSKTSVSFPRRIILIKACIIFKTYFMWDLDKN